MTNSPTFFILFNDTVSVTLFNYCKQCILDFTLRLHTLITVVNGSSCGDHFCTSMG